MKVIYKYQIPFKEVAKINLPKDAKIIRIDSDGALFLWAIVDTEAALEERTFYLYKTGGQMPDDILDYTYHGCGAIHIQQELMMYIFEKPNCVGPAKVLPPPFDWKAVQDAN